MPYVANTDQNRKEMLEKIGVRSFGELLKDIPEELRLKKPLNLPKGLWNWKSQNYSENCPGRIALLMNTSTSWAPEVMTTLFRRRLTKLSPARNFTPPILLIRRKRRRGLCSPFMNFSL